MKKLISTSLFLFVFISLKAQDPFFTLFRQNNLWLNPAAAGMEDKHVFSLSGRTQWQTYHTALLTYDQPLNKINSGIGVVGSYEDYGSGYSRTYHAGLCYNYQLKLTEKMKLGIGLEGAFIRKTIDIQDLLFPTTTGYYPVRSTNNYLDFNAGLWYKWSDFYAGISVKHITGPDVSFLEDGIPDKLYQNYIFTAGYKWKFSKNFSMIPSASFSTQGPSNLLQVNDEFSLNDTYFLGGGYRLITSTDEPISEDAFIISAGVTVKKRIQLMLAAELKAPDDLFPGESAFNAYEANIKYRF